MTAHKKQDKEVKNKDLESDSGLNKEHHDPANTLLGILRGDVGIEQVTKFIREGSPKLDNFSMHLFVEKLRDSKAMDDTQILDMYLALDHAVEENLLTNKLLDAIKESPDVLNQIEGIASSIAKENEENK